MRKKIQVKCLATLLLLAFSAMAQAETPVVEWIRQLGTTSFDSGNGVSVDNNGNAYVTGYTGGSLDGNSAMGAGDIFLTKYDTSGTKLWTEQLGSARDDWSYDVSVDSNGNAYITGSTLGSLDGNTNAGSYDMFLTKYDTNGTKLWTEQLGSTSWDEGHGVSVDGSGNAYVTGWTDGNLDGNTNADVLTMYDTNCFLTKYDTNGTKLWTEQLGSIGGGEEGYGVSVDASGNAYITGYIGVGLDDDYGDMFLTKYDTNGNKLWTEQLDSSSYDKGCGVSVDVSGNVYVTGETDGSLDGNTSAGYADMFLTKYDTNGTKLWTEQLGTTSGDYGIGVSVDGSGNAFVTGYTFGSLDGNTNSGGSDMFLTKYDTDGTKLWTEQLGSDSNDYSCSVSVDGSGKVYVAGSTEGSLDGNPNAGGSDIFLIKISTVPEPGSIAMLVGIALMALLCRRRKSV